MLLAHGAWLSILVYLQQQQRSGCDNNSDTVRNRRATIEPHSASGGRLRGSCWQAKGRAEGTAHGSASHRAAVAIGLMSTDQLAVLILTATEHLGPLRGQRPSLHGDVGRAAPVQHGTPCGVSQRPGACSSGKSAPGNRNQQCLTTQAIFKDAKRRCDASIDGALTHQSCCLSSDCHENMPKARRCVDVLGVCKDAQFGNGAAYVQQSLERAAARARTLCRSSSVVLLIASALAHCDTQELLQEDRNGRGVGRGWVATAAEVKRRSH